MSKERKYFGTDGIRGRLGSTPISVDFILKLGWAVGTLLAGHKHKRATIGRDPRISGYMFESAIQAGLLSAGTDCLLLGTIPTPAIAYLTQTLRAQIGIVISASHNPYHDNGIKFFSDSGYKISDELEEMIEQKLDKPIGMNDAKALGKAYAITDASGRYIEFCKSSIPHHADFEKYKIIVDCANGATHNIAPQVFRELGAEVIAIHTNPDGLNINKNAGSLHPEMLRKMVLNKKADLGIAFDGDGDRVLFIDHTGDVVEGDEILYIITKSLLASNKFNGGVVGTIMSNIGLERALQKINVPFTRVSVGDHNVISELLKRKWSLGGEPSGHIIDLNVASTADGIIGALQVVYAMSASGKSLNELKNAMQRMPQYLINVPVHGDTNFLENPTIKKSIQQIETKLNTNGRILVRPSGTEPLIRIMLEGEDIAMLETLGNELADEIKKYS
jgi:phosphoglucosamine mutase